MLPLIRLASDAAPAPPMPADRRMLWGRRLPSAALDGSGKRPPPIEVVLRQSENDVRHKNTFVDDTPPALAAEGEALLLLFRALGGGLWLRRGGWESTQVNNKRTGGRRVVEHLSGAAVDPYMRRVTKLTLAANRLVGTLPAAVFAPLDKLVRADLSDNLIEGPIPPFSSGPALVDLRLHRNRLSGTLVGLGKLSGLLNVTVNGNRLVGMLLPRELLLGCPALVTLNASDNMLTSIAPPRVPYTDRDPPEGAVLADAITLRNLEALWAADNQFGRDIECELPTPVELFGDDGTRWEPRPHVASPLRVLDFRRNFLSGYVPRQYGSAFASALSHLQLSANNLRGAVPNTVSKLTALRVLDLSMNDLDGALPSELLHMPALRTVWLAGNKGILEAGNFEARLKRHQPDLLDVWVLERKRDPSRRGKWKKKEPKTNKARTGGKANKKAGGR